MKKSAIFLLLFYGLCAIKCSPKKSSEQNGSTNRKGPTSIITDSYELIVPEKHQALLILFPCFPCDAKNTKEESKIVEEALQNNIALLLMNFNQHLWLTLEEKKSLERLISEAVITHNIQPKNIFMGGFSSGGNVTLLLTNYLKSTSSNVQPKGIFIIDSPIDLLGLYEDAKKDIEKNYSETAVEEANWIVTLFDKEFGVGDSSLFQYEMKSPYTSKTHSIQNLTHLKDLDIRLYTEPDTLWWMEHRQTKYEDMNAFYIEQLASDLNKSVEAGKVSFIQTKNQGYRANGEKHPHSWSIVNEKDLIKWILN